MDKVQIIKVNPDGLRELQEIGRKTFAETFSSGNSEENMEQYLENGFSAEKLKIELSDQNSEFYFAMLDNNIIGYRKINFGQSQTDIMMKLQTL